MGKAVRGGEVQSMGHPVLEVDIEPVVHRRSMVVENPHLAESRKGTTGLDVGPRLLRRARVVVQYGCVLVRSLDADVGDVDDVGPELFGNREIVGLQIQVRMLVVGRNGDYVRGGGSYGWRNRILDRRRWGIGGSAIATVAVDQGEARILRWVELQDVDVVELAAVEGDAVGAAHHELTREAIRKAEAG